jgi:hypothetical protein
MAKRFRALPAGGYRERGLAGRIRAHFGAQFADAIEDDHHLRAGHRRPCVINHGHREAPRPSAQHLHRRFDVEHDRLRPLRLQQLRRNHFHAGHVRPELQVPVLVFNANDHPVSGKSLAQHAQAGVHQYRWIARIGRSGERLGGLQRLTCVEAVSRVEDEAEPVGCTGVSEVFGREDVLGAHGGFACWQSSRRHRGTSPLTWRAAAAGLCAPRW